ncbi:MAG: response regulator [Desulfuromonadaceae bacterium]|nr:response regulator [Desulfuromonadaceae bacterium]
MTPDRTDTMAFQALLCDLVENILKHSDNPGTCAQYITTQIRELIGVRVVAILSIDERSDCTLVGICPKKREREWNQPEIQAFVVSTLPNNVPCFIDPVPDHEGRSPSSISIGKSFVIPLIVGTEKVGMLVLLDLMDEAGVKSILNVLTKISSILALILKNSLLYKNLEQRVAERTSALHEQKALFEAIFRCIPDAIVYANIDREVVGINTAFTSIFGFTIDDLAGKKTSFFYENLEEYERQGRIRFNMTAAEHTLPYEVSYRRKDGTIFPGETLGTVVKNDCGTVTGYIGVIRDITGRKQEEEDRQILEQQMQHTQKLESLGVLSGGIAHDFNNILAIIMGYCSLTKMDYETAPKNIIEIEKAAERAAALCRQMLAYAGKAQLTITQVNMWVMVDEMVAMLKSTLPQNAVIKPKLSAGIPYITADASQIRQVVMNLIINASEAIGTEQGEIIVSLTRETVIAGHPEKDYHGKEISPGSYVCLEVTDDGCGMDEETKWRIFEPFYTTKFTGRGLGLSAVLGIINSHGGALQLFSQRGQGTTFKVYFPVPMNDAAGEEDRNHSIPSAPWKGSGTLLLVEDEEQIRFLAKTLLEMFGFTVLEAANGAEALELYQKNAADIRLVVTDMGMPVMDGYALFPALKKLDPELPIIVSSGFGDADVVSRIGRDNIAGIISKPYNMNRLREVLKNVLEGPQPDFKCLS